MNQISELQPKYFKEWRLEAGCLTYGQGDLKLTMTISENQITLQQWLAAENLLQFDIDYDSHKQVKLFENLDLAKEHLQYASEFDLFTNAILDFAERIEMKVLDEFELLVTKTDNGIKLVKK